MSEQIETYGDDELDLRGEVGILPGEPMVRHYPDGSGFPGTMTSAQILGAERQDDDGNWYEVDVETLTPCEVERLEEAAIELAITYAEDDREPDYDV